MSGRNLKRWNDTGRPAGQRELYRPDDPWPHVEKSRKKRKKRRPTRKERRQIREERRQERERRRLAPAAPACLICGRHDAWRVVQDDPGPGVLWVCTNHPGMGSDMKSGKNGHTEAQDGDIPG